MLKFQKFAFILVAVFLLPLSVLANEPDENTYYELQRLDSVETQAPSNFNATTNSLVPARDLSTEHIPIMQYPKTSVFFVHTPQEHSQQVFTIIASSPITGVERLLLEDNRLALNIINSTTTLHGAIAVPANLAVNGIRTSQFTEDTTRIVFDLQSGTDFSISITPDRMMIMLIIHQNTLRDVSFTVGDGFDSIVLSGVNATAVQTQSAQGRIQFFMPNTSLETAIDSYADGIFISDAVLAAFGTGTILELSIKDNISHNIFQSGASETTIWLQPTTYNNIRYDFDERTFRIPKVDGFPLHLEHVTKFDLYHQNQYILWFPVDLSQLLGFGEIFIADALLNSVMIAHSGHGTQMIFNGNQIFTLDLQEDEESYIIRVLHPREKYQNIVIIDPGHGGRFPGAVVNGIRESDLNLQVTEKLLQLIHSNDSIKAYTTRNSDVDFAQALATDLQIRGNFGNNLGDIFISIHHNALDRPTVYGVETYYLESTNDSFRLLTNQNLANIMHRHIIGTTNSNDRGVRSANFAVLRYSEMPAVLLELGFMTNPQELARITTAEFQWQAAWAIYNGLMESFTWMPNRH